MQRTSIAYGALAVAIAVFAVAPGRSTGEAGYFPPLSGVVKTTAGAPISGATVTLLSDAQNSPPGSGALVPLPSGDHELLSNNPANINPQSTSATGAFGWFVHGIDPGFHYQVQASAAGCVSASDPSQPSAFSAVYLFNGSIPFITDLDLRLRCDSTPPTLSLPSNMVQEAVGPSGTPVSYTVSATDPDDAAATLTVACLPASGSTFPIATTTVHCSAHDPVGNTTGGSFTVTVKDSTAPVLSLPPSITVNATGPSGTAVTFVATATDLVDGHDPVICTPASGRTFPIGVTSVHCTAADAAGNSSSGSVTVTVRGATAQLVDLQTEAAGVGPGASLAGKLQAAADALSSGDTSSACGSLQAFLNEVAGQNGKKLSPTLAAQLTTDATRLRAVLGC